MNGKWSLLNLYAGFEDPKYKEDEKKFEETIDKFSEYCRNFTQEPGEVLKDCISMMSEIENRGILLLGFSELSQSVNTTDQAAAAASGRLLQKISKCAEPRARFVRYVAQTENLEKIINEDPLLKEHEFLLKNMKENEKYTLSPEVEKAISLYQISGSGAWSDLQGYLTSTVKVDYKGETTTLSDIRNKAYSADGETRKSAYEAELKAYEKIKDGIAFSLNSIKLEVINHCKLRGYESPLDEALKDSKMKRETLDALIEAMKEYLPKFREYLKAKAKILGYEKGLPWFELFAPLKGNEETYTVEECRDKLVNLFSKFDKEEADLIARAFDEEWIDFYPGDGKVGGAFCEGIHPLGESRILTNYDGTLGDVVTLAHELGHAFHNYCLRENSVLNTDVSMPVAETASTFNEVVAMNEAISGEKDPMVKRALIESQLMDAAQIICDIYSRYLFETAVFEKRSEEFLFADSLCEIMLDAQKQAYGGSTPKIVIL